jgi:hypothetical protein
LKVNTDDKGQGVVALPPDNSPKESQFSLRWLLGSFVAIALRFRFVGVIATAVIAILAAIGVGCVLLSRSFGRRHSKLSVS